MESSVAAEAPPAAPAAPEPETKKTKKPRRKRWSWRIGFLLLLSVGAAAYFLSQEAEPPHSLHQT
jgi:hypothetical protein